MLTEIVLSKDKSILAVPKEEIDDWECPEKARVFAFTKDNEIMIMVREFDDVIWEHISLAVEISCHEDEEEAIEYAINNGWRVFVVSGMRDFMEMMDGFKEISSTVPKKKAKGSKK